MLISFAYFDNLQRNENQGKLRLSYGLPQLNRHIFIQKILFLLKLVKKF